MKYKPQKAILDKFKANVKSDTIFSSNARLLQSIWRTETFGNDAFPEIELGNMLPINFAKSKKANFFSERVGNLVEFEIKCFPEKVIGEPRIWDNLLSSQPLAFNLFGELMLETGLHTATKLFNRLFNGEVKKVTRVEFEYSPSRRNPRYTNDRSAFDVFVEYISTTNKIGFFGIEVKYSENMQDRPAKLKDRYDAIAKKMGIFRENKLDLLKKTNLQQLWRDHLLAGSLFKANNDYEKGHFIILYPKDNIQCENKINQYRKTFKVDDKESSFFYPITLEDFIDELKRVSDANWIKDFFSRYLDFSIIDKL